MLVYLFITRIFAVLAAMWSLGLIVGSLMKRFKLLFTDLIHCPPKALTAYALSSDEKIIIDAGFDYYLSKPVSKVKLLEAINPLIKKK